MYGHKIGGTGGTPRFGAWAKPNPLTPSYYFSLNETYHTIYDD